MKKPPIIDDANELGTEPAYVRDLLDAGRADVAGYDFQAGLARHVANVQAGAPLPEWAQSLVEPAAGGAGATATAAGSGALGMKLLPWIAGSIAAAGLATAVVLTRPAPVEAPTAPVARVAPLAPVADPAPGPALVVEQPKAVPAAADVDLEASDADGDEPQGVGAADTERDPNRVLRAIKRDHARRASLKGAAPSSAAKLAPVATPVAPSQVAPTTDDTPSRATRSTPSASATAERETTAARAESAAPSEATAQPAPKPVLDDARLEREMGMLAMAQRVLTSDPERALRLARQGEREFAGSMFTQERQQVLLLALIELNRMDEAKRLARPYLQRYPNGPFSDRLRRALVTGKVEH